MPKVLRLDKYESRGDKFELTTHGDQERHQTPCDRTRLLTKEDCGVCIKHVRASNIPIL